MKRIYLMIVAALIVAAAVFDGDHRAAGSKPSPGATRDLTTAELRQTMDRIFRAQIRASLAWTDSLAATCDGEPAYHLMRARLYRELIPVDDEEKEAIKQASGTLFTELDRVNAICDRRIDEGDKTAQLYLYRGWARMMMSHMHTYERSWWSAGRDAKKGKGDLETYLQLKPNDPNASSLMGAFLYFADTLPAAYKFVSKLLLLPSGDRERGLRMMELARGWNSLMETDNALILYSVYMGFEGRYEEGLEGFDYLQREFPLHATFQRPDAIIYPLLPKHGVAFGDKIDAAMARIDALPLEEQDIATRNLIRFERAFADRYYAPDRAVERFEQILRDEPAHPDWVPGFAAFELGRLMASRGDTDRARIAWDRVLNDQHVSFLHGETRDMLKDMQDKVATGAGPRHVASIYGDDDEARKAVRKEIEAKKDPSVADMFYLGEAWLMAGEPDKALKAYTGAINPKAARFDEGYQLLAASRAGEILGSKGEYKAASKHFETAGKFWHKEFLFDWLLAARQRYYQRLDEGKETTPPTILITSGR
jgi:tetratricopeptide (TPR) repeat protein